MKDLRSNHGVAIPNVSDQSICFTYLTSAGCPGHMPGITRAQVPCNQLHINIDHFPANYSKEKLRELYKYVTHTKRQSLMRASKHFESFML
jgi:hypothetical protein